MRRELIRPEQHPSGSGAWKRAEAKEARFRDVEAAQIGDTLPSLGPGLRTCSALGVLTISWAEELRIRGRGWKELGITRRRPCAPEA